MAEPASVTYVFAMTDLARARVRHANAKARWRDSSDPVVIARLEGEIAELATTITELERVTARAWRHFMMFDARIPIE